MLLHLFFLMLILAAAASTNASKNHGKMVAPKKTEDSPARGGGESPEKSGARVRHGVFPSGFLLCAPGLICA